MSDLRYWLKSENIPAGVPFSDGDEIQYVFVEPGDGTRTLYYHEGGKPVPISDDELGLIETGVNEWSLFLELPPPPKTDVELIAEFVRNAAKTSESWHTAAAMKVLAEQIERGNWKNQ